MGKRKTQNRCQNCRRLEILAGAYSAVIMAVYDGVKIEEVEPRMMREAERKLDALPSQEKIMGNLLTLPLETPEDRVLCKVVATFLAKQGVDDLSSLPLAMRLLTALERYSNTKDIERCASNLGVSLDTVEAYRKQEGE